MRFDALIEKARENIMHAPFADAPEARIALGSLDEALSRFGGAECLTSGFVVALDALFETWDEIDATPGDPEWLAIDPVITALREAVDKVLQFELVEVVSNDSLEGEHDRDSWRGYGDI
jgi:hypothetical protein